MKGDYANRILLRMIQDMSGGAQDELSDIFQELSGEMMDPQKLMEMASRAMGIDLDQLAGMMGRGAQANTQGATMGDPYQILGLDRSASDDDIKKRYQDLMKRLHPDVAGEGTNFLATMVNLAYQQIGKERGWQ